MSEEETKESLTRFPRVSRQRIDEVRNKYIGRTVPRQEVLA